MIRKYQIFSPQFIKKGNYLNVQILSRNTAFKKCRYTLGDYLLQMTNSEIFLKTSYFLVSECMFQIQFVVEARCKSEQSVHIVGNLPSLGCWDPLKGLKLQPYDDDEWESSFHIEVPHDVRFQFKIVKVSCNGAVQWEQLPNNANRKFKPKHHSQLQLKWSSGVGKVVNIAKSSYHVKGLPGVFIKDVKQAGVLRKKNFDPDSLARKNESSSESDSDDPYSSVVSRRKSADIQSLMSKGSIEQIYYETTELEVISSKRQKNKIYLVCFSWEGKEDFCFRIMEEIKELHDSEDIYFKWLFFQQSDKYSQIKSKRKSFRNLSQEVFSTEKFQIDKYAQNNTHFIFIDLKSAMMIDLGTASACLYLPSSDYDSFVHAIGDLTGFRFVCFDSPQKNKELFEFIKGTRHSEVDEDRPINFFDQKLTEVSLYKVIEELHYSHHASMQVNTVHTFTKHEAREKILMDNCLLVIDSGIFKRDPIFFKQLVSTNLNKRLVLIVHGKSGTPDWLKAYFDRKNIFIILQNYSKFYFLGKMYQPLKKHDEALSLFQMKLKLYAQSVKYDLQRKTSSLILKFDEPNNKFVEKLKTDYRVIFKQLNYFKISCKESKVKISWNLSEQMRLLRTICRIKLMEDGQIGDFYLVAESQDFSPLKQEIQILIKKCSILLKDQSPKKIYDFGYGNCHSATYSIKSDEEPVVN